jgi:hypothetical protein
MDPDELDGFTGRIKIASQLTLLAPGRVGFFSLEPVRKRLFRRDTFQWIQACLHEFEDD